MPALFATRAASQGQKRAGTALESVRLMERWVTINLIVLFMGWTGGCATRDEWVGRCGGLAGGAVEERARRVAAPLVAACGEGRIALRVLDSDAVTAYAWPGGEIYLTRGLLERMDDAEVAAAVAHEIGHLLNDGHLNRPVGLKGCDAAEDEEAAADRTGVELLNRCGIEGAAMRRMLGIVASHSTSPCRADVQKRAGRVER